MCSALVTFAGPVVTDNCQVNAVTLLTPSTANGTLFPPGVMQGMYWANDTAGNFANCTYTVAVFDRELPAISELKLELFIS